MGHVSAVCGTAVPRVQGHTIPDQSTRSATQAPPLSPQQPLPTAEWAHQKTNMRDTPVVSKCVQVCHQQSVLLCSWHKSSSTADGWKSSRPRRKHRVCCRQCYESSVHMQPQQTTPQGCGCCSTSDCPDTPGLTINAAKCEKRLLLQQCERACCPANMWCLRACSLRRRDPTCVCGTA